jgi:CheY-like chemotaxis protein
MLGVIAMKVLIIEDDENKRGQLIEFLKEATQSSTIVEARSLQSALKRIIDDTFDLIFLDMTLPTFDIGVDEDGGRPRVYGGREILRQMDRRGIVTPVIMVTQFDRFGKGAESLTLQQLDRELRKAHSKNYRGSVYYNVALEDWKDVLSKFVRELGSREIS